MTHCKPSALKDVGGSETDTIQRLPSKALTRLLWMVIVSTSVTPPTSSLVMEAWVSFWPRPPGPSALRDDAASLLIILFP